jgi:hypothetical protein
MGRFALGFDGQQAGHVFPVELLVAELAASSIGAAPIGPEPVAPLFLGLLRLNHHQVVPPVGEPALPSIGAITFFLIGPAQFCFVFDHFCLAGGAGAVVAVAGGGPGGRGRGRLGIEVLQK